MASAAESIATQLVSAGWAGIEDLVIDKRGESLHLDFTVPELNRGKLEKSDRRKLGKALSGFANADGGILLWGVDCRKDARGHDRAVGIEPVKELGRFSASLENLTPDMVAAAVPGVTHTPIDDPKDPNRGVVVTFVPASDLTPHMATGPGQHRYYRRSGSNFFQMEHHEVADLFGRRPQPKLEVSCDWWARLTGTSGHEVTAILEARINVRNMGRGIARFVSLSIDDPQGKEPGSTWKAVESSFREVRAASQWWRRFALSADEILYPDDQLEMAKVRFSFTSTSSTGDPLPDITIPVAIMAQGTQCVEDSISITADTYRQPLLEIFKNREGMIQL